MNNLPIEFRTNYDGHARAFLVIVPDAAVNALFYGHPLRALHAIFNGGGRNSGRLYALADALRACEDGSIAYPGFFRNALNVTTAAFRAVFINPFRRKHPDDVLIDRFSAELKMKLARAREHGKSGWQHDDWMDECRVHLIEHLLKGDPRDVANYCAFLWHHGESTKTALTDWQRSLVRPQINGKALS